MSLTSTVPSVAPSLFQNSVPSVASVAAKKTVLPTGVSEDGFEPVPGPTLMSSTDQLGVRDGERAAGEGKGRDDRNEQPGLAIADRL